MCAIRVADCMPVLLADESAHAWSARRTPDGAGLSAGVIEDTRRRDGRRRQRELLAWLGPAIGPKVYEVGEEVRAAFLSRDAAAEAAFSPRGRAIGCSTSTPWRASACARAAWSASSAAATAPTRTPQRFYSYRRDGTSGRMAAYVWLA